MVRVSQNADSVSGECLYRHQLYSGSQGLDDLEDRRQSPHTLLSHIGWHFWLYADKNVLTRALVGRGAVFCPPPSSLFAISLKLLSRSSPNFQYPLVHSVYTLCPKIVPEPLIGWPQMTSEWRHVQPFLTPKKVSRKELSCLQFWRWEK